MEAVNYYHKELHPGCCSCHRSAYALYNRRSNIFPHIGSSEISLYFTRDCLSLFSWSATFVFPFQWKNSPFQTWFENISKVLHVHGPQILNIRCLFYHDHVLSLNLNLTLNKNASVLRKVSDGRPLSSLITKHCPAKN